MKVLIISTEVWRNDQNGGNTLTWMFSGFPSYTEFAQVYCSEGDPDNTVCSNYYKLSTGDIARALIHGKKDAGVIIESTNSTENYSHSYSSKKNSLLVRITGSKIIRDMVWKTGFFKSDKLRSYILEINPDIIYAPCYGVNYMNYLIQWVSSFTNCPIVSLISDDFYSFHQKNLNPFFWIYLLNLRKNVRKSVSHYKLIYTMTDMQKKQLEKDFNIPVELVQKGYYFDEAMLGKAIAEPIKILHVGNLYYNRWKTICLVADCINSINATKKKYQIEIVTSYSISEKIRKQLESRGVIIHNNVSEDRLKEIYKGSDIALHVEGFDLVNRLKMQMSFSTKIIEYLASGCAIMMICDNRQSTYQYISSNDIGICIDSTKNIKDTLIRLCEDVTRIKEYQIKAFEFGKNNHSINSVSQKLYCDFCKMI